MNQSNYFAFYNFPVQFGLDQKELKKRYVEKSREFHPDFHTQKGAEAADLALKMTTYNNLAFNTLKNDRKRIEYLLEIAGFGIDDGKEALPNAFLMEMMELNERLDEATPDSPDALELQKEIDGLLAERDNAVALLMQNYDQAETEEEKSTILKKSKIITLECKYFLRLKEKVPYFVSSN